MFFDLYYKIDKEKLTSDRFVCEVLEKDGHLVVELTRFEGVQVGNWGKPSVLTDVYATIFNISKTFSGLVDKSKLEEYIKSTWDSELKLVDRLGEVSTSKHEIEISLPVALYPTLRGLPVGDRAINNTYYPVSVTLDGKDVSSVFQDFSDFKEDAVRKVYHALILGSDVKSKNDLFYIEGVKKLREALTNSEAQM